MWAGHKISDVAWLAGDCDFLSKNRFIEYAGISTVNSLLDNNICLTASQGNRWPGFRRSDVLEPANRQEKKIDKLSSFFLGTG